MNKISNFMLELVKVSSAICWYVCECMRLRTKDLKTKGLKTKA